MNRPLPDLLTAFIVGIALSPYLSFRGGKSLAVAAILLFLIILFVLSCFNLKKKLDIAFLLLSWLVFAGIGCLYARPFSLEQEKPGELLSLADGRTLRLAGILEKMPVFMPDRTELVIKVEQCFVQEEIRPLNGRLLVYLKDRPQLRLSCGDRILWMGSLQPVLNFKNPGAFDFENYMSLRDIYVTSWVSDAQLLAVIGHSGPSLSGFIETFRHQIQTFLDTRTSPLAASIYKALIIGDRGGIPKEVKEAFARAGVNHILAISGLHMGIVALAVYASILWVIKRFPYLLLRFSAFKVAALFSIPIVLVYGAIAGMSPPSIRAMVMVSVFLVAVLLNRQWDIYNNLAIAIWGILLFSPRTLYTPSFQLSVVAVFSIVFFYQRWQSWTKEKMANPLAKLRPRPFPVVDKLLDKLWKLVLISVIAALGTAPIVAYYFYRLSFAGFLSNVIVIPLMGLLILPLGLVSVVLMPFSLTLADIFLQAGSLALTAMVKVIEFFAAWPIASVWVARPYVLEIILFYAGVLLMAMASRHRVFKWCGLACLSIIFIVGVTSAYQRNNCNLLQITFLDVGQGNAALVEFPGGKNMIIDGGGTFSSQFDVGERVVGPFLRTKRVRTIDYIVLTHPHPDHLGGLVFLVDTFNVKEVWTNGDSMQTDLFANWQRLISRRGIPQRVFNVDGRHTFNINGVTIDIYSPDGGIGENSRPDSLLNRRSLVIGLSYGRRHFLFPGDIDAHRESELLQRGCILKSDVLLSPHHGSNTSSTEGFIRAVAPKVAVFSVGRLNRFFFPHSNVLRRYLDMGCSIYRTDRDGAITCQTDGRNLKIERFSTGGY